MIESGPGLREQREALGVTRSALAIALGRDLSNVWRLENRATVRPATARAYMDALRAVATEEEAQAAVRIVARRLVLEAVDLGAELVAEIGG